MSPFSLSPSPTVTSNPLLSSILQDFLPQPCRWLAAWLPTWPRSWSHQRGLPRVPASHLASLHLCPQNAGFPPASVNKPPLLPKKTEVKSCHFSTQNPLAHAEPKPKSLGRLTRSSLLCTPQSLLPPRLAHSNLLALVPGTDQASCWLLQGLCICKILYLVWHPPTYQKGSLPCSL